MNEYQIVQIISLVGFLVLAGSALASYKLSWSKALRMALIWGSIFCAMALFFSIIEFRENEGYDRFERQAPVRT